MKITRKVLALLLAVLMVAALFAGCADTTDDTSDDKSSEASKPAADDKDDEGEDNADATEYEWEYQEDTSPFEFTVWWPSPWAWAKGGAEGGWDTSIPIYNYITEKTGVTMNIDVPAGTEDELAGAMIASGTYPDACVFGSYNSTYLAQMKDAKLIHSWTKLIDEYAPKMWELIPESMMVYHADENGDLWSYVGFAYHETWGEESKALGNEPAGATAMFNVIFCREDTLEAFGQDDITDLETFNEYLSFVNEEFPDLDPIQLFDNDPRGTVFTHMRSTFGCHLSGTYPQEDGSIKWFMYDPAYVDYLTWLNQLYLDGIITDNQLTDDGTALNTKQYAAQYGAMLQATYTVYNTINNTLAETYGEDSGMLYKEVGPIQKEGVKWVTDYTRNKGSFATVITNNAENPERVLKFFEFLLTEEAQISIHSGVEANGDWWWNEDGTVGHKEEIANAALTSLEGFVNEYRLCGNWAPWCGTTYWEGLLGPMITPPDGPLVDINNKRLGSDKVVDIWLDGYASITDAVEPGSDLAVIRTKVEEACKIAGMKMIAAKNADEFNAIYEACLEEIEGLGVAQIEEVYTAEHKAQCESLGIEP